ncbi:FLUCTUATING-LIGHT-ACCLIMATION protein 1, chloroplastic-like [Aristolochia californica]|uniref:FLUCTUATING-LIGHT-ACCLIMATION protein 1, chloroplastic-like n=1 Tax=Aristolochia californica TaxID=171875 RepID=UPI0035D6A223
MAAGALLKPRSIVREIKFPILKWNPLLQNLPFQLIRIANVGSAAPKSVGFRCSCSKVSTKDFGKPRKKNAPKGELELPARDKNPFEVALEAVVKTLKSLQKPVVAAILLGLLLTYDPSSALAASGGRMGGRAFSSHSSSSSSRSYSVPGRTSSFSYSAPYFAPSPFGFGGGGGGFYVGPAFGVGVGAGSGFLLMMGFAAAVLLSGFLSDRSDDDSVLTATQKTSVVKLQVGLLGMARTLQRDLDRIAETADTSTSEGLHYVLTETVLALLRHPDYCISGYSLVDVKRSVEDGEKRFNQLSIEERGKFDEETLVNVNSIKKQSTRSQRFKGFSNEYIVITILVAAEGVHKLPVINGNADLKQALQKLGSIPANRTLAVEVLWTPQNENDTLSERELLEDYPLLRPL